MFIIRCKSCHKENEYPNVLRCPFCNKVFSECSDELAMKHIIRCAYSLNPRQYSDRGRGRPKAEKGGEPDDDLFKLMESSVKGDPDVKECRQRLADVKSSILSRICAGYPEYREAVAAYRDAVKKAYRDMQQDGEHEKVPLV